MPFGLCSAPSYFQELVGHVLKGAEQFSAAYQDDILIWSRNPEEHLIHLKEVFDRLRKAGLNWNVKSVIFLKRSYNI